MPNNIRQQVLYLGASGDPEQYQDSILQYPGTLGASGTFIQPVRTPPGVEAGRSKTYQLVQTDSTMTVSPFPGAVAWWRDKTNYKVTTDAAATGGSRGNIAGVFQTNITKGNYCYIQTQGPATVKIIDSAAAATVAGDMIIPSSTNAKADRVAAGTAPTYPTLGICVVAANGNAEAVVQLDVPQTT